MFINFNLLLPTMPVFFCWLQTTKLYKYAVKASFAFALACTQFVPVSAQSVSNGNFNSTSTGWGCSPEATHRESTYGGTSSTNRVAEVDKQAGLCQTISGFTVGYEYELSFKCSRRTTCGPTLQTMDVTISGNALSESISRNGGGFNFTTESFSFVASSTSHTLTFTGTVSGTCGLIVDDIEVNFVSALPVELLHFDGVMNNNNQVELTWATAMELNNDYFSIERSQDGINWGVIEEIKGAGNANEVLNYETTDATPLAGSSYYRLKQTDFDGTFTYSKIVHVQSINNEKTSIHMFPNPTTDKIMVTNLDYGIEVQVLNSVGQNVTGSVKQETNRTDGQMVIDMSGLPNGLYHVVANNKSTIIKKR